MRPLFAVLAAVLLHSTLVAQGIVVDHSSGSLFDRIPRRFVDDARALRLLFMDRSVGGNINDALNCLSVPFASAPSSCKRYQHRDSAYAVDPSEVRWEGAWDRGLWRYEYWPTGCSEDAECFIEAVEPRIDSFDVVGFQHSYLAVAPGTSLHDPVNGYFGSGTGRATARTYAAFAARHPDKHVIWWTTSLARSIGTPESQAFNDSMRAYAREHDVTLFDVADILSHDPAGRPCHDNRDGVAYLAENYPDDGLNIPAICPQYTTETEGGHLGSISAGGIRVAKAFWVLMARIAGWDGVSTDSTSGTYYLHENPPDLSLTVTPIPTRNGIVARYDHGHSVAWLEVIDVNGRLVAGPYHLTGGNGAGELHIPLGTPHAPPGIYLVRLRSTNGERTQATVVEQ